MNIAQITDNLEKLVESFNKDTFIFNLLLAYGTPKAMISRLQQGDKNMFSEETVIIKKNLFFKSVEDEDLQTVINSLKQSEKVSKQAPHFIAVTYFENYQSKFKEVQEDLKAGKRTIIEFKLGNLKEGAYYLHNGVLFYLEKINITKNDHYRPDGTRVRTDGRTRCIFENGTESNMLKRSVEKILYANGNAITEKNETSLNKFEQNYSGITDEDKEFGFIYILKSKSEKSEIKTIKHLYKIGFTTTTVEERIKDAAQEPTYLMADVRIIMTYRCFNMNAHKLELLLHNFFGSSCLNVDVFDNLGNRHTPREWFIAPLDIIEQAVQFIISGEIVKYRYDGVKEDILIR